jgi:hypothetical protein
VVGNKIPANGGLIDERNDSHTSSTKKAGREHQQGKI